MAKIKQPIAKKVICSVSSETSKNVVSEGPEIDLSRDHISREEIERIAGMNLGSDISLFQRAFVHKSIEKLARQDPRARDYMKKSNETLEFVGDSMIGAVVADYLFQKYPTKNEGFLTTTRTKIVQSKMLSHFAEKLGMSDKILMASQAIKTGGRTNRRFLEDAFESFVGALYYDKGYLGVQKFMLRVIDKFFDDDLITKNENYKDILLRYSQYIKVEHPEYNIISECGPPHNREFLVEVRLLGSRQGKAKEKTLKKAEQLAAKEAISRLGIPQNF